MIILVAVFSIVIAKADTVVTVDGYTYSLNQRGMAVLTGWDNSSETLYVPHYIGNVLVAEIGDSAFSNDDFIKTLDLSDANRMYHIGEFAFANSVLTGALVIPTRVTYVGVAAFQNCDSLTSVQYSSDGGAVSAQCFMDCDNLEKVILTDYITSIGQYSFQNCPALTDIYMPKNIRNIDSTAFENSENVVIHCFSGSYAQQYAEENGISYQLRDYTYLSGDADGDGKITILDATKIQRLLVAMVDDADGMIALRGDSDGDGLNILDATRVQRYLASLNITASIGETVTSVLS